MNTAKNKNQKKFQGGMILEYTVFKNEIFLLKNIYFKNIDFLIKFSYYIRNFQL